MPVRRFRSFEEARRALWVDSSDPGLTRRIRRLWAFSTRLLPRMIPRGVRKFRTIDEANREREQWIQQRVDTVRQKANDGLLAKGY